MSLGKSFKIYEKIEAKESYSVIMEKRDFEEGLLFQSDAVSVIPYEEMFDLKKKIRKIADVYGSLGVLQYSTNSSVIHYLVLITGCTSVGRIHNSEIFQIVNSHLLPLKKICEEEEKLGEIRKLLNSGSFYFSWSNNNLSSDLTTCFQKKYIFDKADNRFFWNKPLYFYPSRFGIDCKTWFFKVICGAVEIRTLYVGQSQAKACLIARLSCERVGTRFQVRGLNDDGHVANFVETEQIIYIGARITSFIQIRGSLPLFWEQPGLQIGSHKIKFSRPPELSAFALNCHLNNLKLQYNKIIIVNLLGSQIAYSSESEEVLSHVFQESKEGFDVPHILFDYHTKCHGGNKTALVKLWNALEQYLTPFEFFYVENDIIVKLQKGVARTNCLDCLDRTNSVQMFIALEMLNKQLVQLNIMDKKQLISRFLESFKEMWINCGNLISQMYAGTGALEGKNKLIDGARSAARTIQSNLMDVKKQEAIDLFLMNSSLTNILYDRAHRFLPKYFVYLRPELISECLEVFPEYTENLPLFIAVGTYNVNGGRHFRSIAFKDDSLTDWLFPSLKNKELISLNDVPKPVDIYAIGFQEIVDLNTTNIISVSSEHAQLWEKELTNILSQSGSYLLLSRVQLVGICLYIFIRKELSSCIKEVATNTVKTGLGGATGNKGAVAVRFNIHNTSICFICAHFTAGQGQIYERNADYTEISKRINFGKNRILNSHDYIFWCGDFNYRIELDNSIIHDSILQQNWSQLLQADQLKMQQLVGQAFVNYKEGNICFPPTYKYDLFSDDYDTSEKARAPSWTDRVLWTHDCLNYKCKKENCGAVNIIYYGRADLKQSDHRPVIAIFGLNVLKVIPENFDSIFKKIVDKIGPLDATLVACIKNNDENMKLQVRKPFMEEIIKSFACDGEISLIYFMKTSLIVIFKESTSVLKAMNSPIRKIQGYEIHLKLKTLDWQNKIIGLLEEQKISVMPLYKQEKDATYCSQSKLIDTPNVDNLKEINSVCSNLSLLEKCTPPPVPKRESFKSDSDNSLSKMVPLPAPPPIPSRCNFPPIPPRN